MTIVKTDIRGEKKMANQQIVWEYTISRTCFDMSNSMSPKRLRFSNTIVVKKQSSFVLYTINQIYLIWQLSDMIKEDLSYLHSNLIQELISLEPWQKRLKLVGLKGQALLTCKTPEPKEIPNKYPSHTNPRLSIHCIACFHL